MVWSSAHHQPRKELTLYGNIDLRQIDLPFNGNERIAAVLVQEATMLHATSARTP